MKTVFALFETPESADNAIRALNEMGYNEETINILGQEDILSSTHHSETAESAGAGAGIGGLIGLIAGATSLAIPGIGPVIGAGTLVGSTLSGAGLGAGVGGLVGVIREWFDEDEPAERYEEAIRKGHVLLAIKTGEKTHDTVENVLREHGAYDTYVHDTAPLQSEKVGAR